MSRLRGEVERALATIPVDFGGGCSVRKAHVMAWLIRRFGLRTSLDIGVYRGRSLVPQAIAHRLSGGGTVYGVDPWCALEADERDHVALRAEISDFVATTDFEQLYRDVVQGIADLGVAPYTTIIRTTSGDAARRFTADGTRFGLIHVDGNHDTKPVLRDVRDYLPLLEPGGFLVMDDVSWPSVAPAVAEVSRQARLVLWRVAADRRDDYAVFRKPGGRWAPAMGLRLWRAAA